MQPTATFPAPNPPSRSNGGAPPSERRLAFDNLLRRELRVGDPNDPEQIAKALMDRYQADPRARAIHQEAQGLPFLQSPTVLTPQVLERTATGIDLEQATTDVHKDLEELVGNNLLKDVAPELQGWSDAIRSAMIEGVNAARFGLDPRSRDRAFGIRRTLGDYARMARLLGALTPAMNHNYRSLAQSLDEVAAVILVMIGESMANAGFAGGRFLLQAPYGEMQTRRDAVMHALQNLLGSLRYTNEPDEWPRGIDAYRRLFDALEAQGQGDLRALMTEQELARIMDGLVRRAAEGSADGLRALGSTAQIDLQRVYRLIHFGYRLVDPESPPLTSFLESLRLFADGFGVAGGSRLLRVARPPIVFYGLYGTDDERAADRRLTQLTVWRGQLANLLDCRMRCDCSEESGVCQVLLDKALYDLDRAIDMYAVGQNDLGLPELRASAYSYLIDELLPAADVNATYCTCLEPGFVSEADDESGASLDAQLRRTLRRISRWLRPQANTTQLADWEPGTPGRSRAQIYEEQRLANDPVAGTSFRFTDVLYQELCLQLDAERRWEHLVAQMAPNCVPPSRVFGEEGALITLIRNAMDAVAHNASKLDKKFELDGPDIPAHFETSLDSLVHNFGRDGSGR